MPQFRYFHEGVEHAHDANDLTEAINRAGHVIRDHRHHVRWVDIDGQYDVGLAEDLLLPDEVVAVPTAYDRQRTLGLARAIIPPPILVTVAGHTVADLHQQLGDLDLHAEVRLASRYPTPRQAGFHAQGPFLEAAQDTSVYLCEGRALGDLPAEATRLLGW